MSYARGTTLIPAYMGDGAGVRRADEEHVFMRLWSLTSGRYVRAYLPKSATSTSTDPLTMADDLLPLDDYLLCIRPRGNIPPLRDEWEVVAATR